MGSTEGRGREAAGSGPGVRPPRLVFARKYGVDGAYARDAIMASTALSMVTLTVAATLLQ